MLKVLTKQSTNWLNTIITILCVIILITIGISTYQHYAKPSILFFANDTKQRIYPLTEPNVASKTLLNWAMLAASDSYTLDFVTFEEKLANIKNYFTLEGFKNFNKSLIDSGNIEQIISKRLIMSAVPIGSPIISKEGLLGKYYVWEIHFPMLITVQSASNLEKRKVMVSLLITRVPTHLNAKGIGIAQFVSKSTNVS